MTETMPGKATRIWFFVVSRSDLNVFGKVARCGSGQILAILLGSRKQKTRRVAGFDNVNFIHEALADFSCSQRSK
ncbi:Uncharacterised protein [Escherichia coli]|uniref:Uncharacterized protein n=1 Tax=Escherichia coli TaxID=562 RepID=A0A377AM91_ECOLX|nr:Uncharacterised protein [Escherichia coli]